MEVYISLMIWSIFSASVFLFKINTKLKKIIYFLLTYIPLVFISGLRGWNVGTDTKLFHQWYEGTRNINVLDWKWFITLSDGSSIEFGFSYIGYIFNLFFYDAQAMIFLYSVITILGIGYAFYKYSKSIWLSTFLFIALFSYEETFNPARQSFAVMIMLNAFGYLRDNCRLKYLGMVILSMIFHFSAIVYGFLVLFMPIKIKKIVYSVLFSVVIIFLGWDFILMLAAEFAPKYLAYMNSVYTTGRAFGPGLIQILAVMILMMISYVLYKKNQFNMEEKRELVIYNIFMFFFIIVTFFQYILPIISRFNIYVFIYINLLIPLLLTKIKNISIFVKFIMYSCIIIVGFIYCIICMKLGLHGVVPYSFCF
ncbi:EpsG family protein [Megamonas hypermegale]|uniref:EpsG family protein n=1 Tax=Megamonas hypermegale TaxID=158847 RepID=UPI0026F20480|nr:EpsG family protein [Megamonas hypermegale]